MSFWSDTLIVTLVALAADGAAGYPAWLFARIGHPVTWIGRLIAVQEERFNQPERSFSSRRHAGLLTLIGLLATTGGAAFLMDGALRLVFASASPVILGLIAASLIAQRSLYDHVREVADGLDRGLPAGREAVSRIVGRDPQSLDASGIARAAIESLAENFSDGVVAPTFYTALGGLTGGALYKAVNTADSMIGHRNPRYEAYGWAAARLDDLVNLPASRLSALFIVVAAFIHGDDAKGALRAVLRDARHHRSPNAGWPEAAMAGALGLRLAGPRIYAGVRVEDRWMGEGRAEANAADIRRALVIMRTASLVQAALVAALLAVTLA